MKKSTKVIATVVAVSTILVGAVGCGKKSVEGKYTANYDISEELGCDEGSYVIEATLELDDGEFIMTMDSTPMFEAMAKMYDMELTEEDLEDAIETVEGEYTVDGDTITFTAEGDDLEATIEDGNIVMDLEGAELVFEK